MAAVSKADVFEAIESFTCEIDGEAITVNKGERVRAGHAILDAQRASFRPLADGPIRFDVEDASASPGTKRGR